MLDYLKVAYGISGFLMVAAYLPVLFSIWHAKERDKTLFGWFIWWISSIIGVLYATFIVNNNLLMYVQIGHMIGTSSILLLCLSKPVHASA